MKKFLFVITLLLSTRFGFAQVMGGGRGNNSPSPQEVKAAELTKGAYNSDVNLFTGGLSTSYTLGTVSTPSGLSYTLSMSYSSAFSVGDNAPLCKGIGYGEGWNLNLPTISVSTETYSKYSQTQMANFNQLGNDNLYPTFNGGEAANEGKTFWMAPEINIPGVVSDRFVYKFTDNEGELVFVPSRFDSYVEARLKDNAWRVIINDGTVYEFGVSAVNVRNASNQRYLVENSYPGPLWMDADDFFAGNNNIQPTTITYGIGAYTVYGGKRYVCIANVLYGSHNASKPTNSSYWTFVEDVNYTPNMPYSDVYTPKFEYLNWTVSKIYHPNYPNGQQIQFIYENYGAFNFFSEYLQNNFVKAIGNYTNNFTVYKDQYLKTVRSLENFGNDYIEKIDLKYKTEYPDPAVYPNPESSLSLLMLPGQDDVFRKDSLYNYKVVYSTGLEGTDAALIDPSNTSLTNTTSQNFDNWARYYHVRSDEVQSHIGVVNTDMVGTNPYVLSGTTTPTDGGWVDYNPSGVNETMYRTLTEADDLPFDHCFLESPKIGYNSTFMPAGDIYEIRTLISNTNSDKYCNFDINVVAGLKNPNEPLTGNETAPGSSIEDLNHNLYQRNRHTTLFTTFNQAVKWNTIPINSSGNGRVISSNFFTMPNLPADFEGFRIQVGPGNSDQNFACYGSAGYNIKYPIDVNSTTPNAYRAYFNVINEPNAIAQLKTGCNSIPYNFGIGYEWHMMRKVASNMAGNLYNYNDSRYNKWWSFNGYNYWDNNPTLANENVNLHAVELIRYSKNPYMLSSVEVSRTNGADITTGKSKEVLVSKLSFDYSIAVGDIANNTDASLTAQQSTITTHPYQKQYVFQLSKIVEIPVNSANGNNPVSGFNINAAPTTHFSYNDISMAAGLDSVGGRRLNASAYVITSIVDRLGGKTEYEYVESPSNRIITSLYTLPVGGFTLPATIFNSDIQMGKPISMTGVISVSKKIIIDQNQNKDWEYTYSNGPKYSYNSPINLGNHFEDGATKWDGGFVITTVKEPLINSNPNRVRSEYTHYTDEQSRLLFGKLKKVQSRDAGNALLDQKEYEYFANVAYESGFYRDNNYDPTTNPNNLVDNYYDINTRQYYTGNYGDYANFSNGDVQIIPAPINGNSSATINFTGTEIGDMLYLEQATPALFYARYLNSYFIPISKEKNSNYDIQIASPVLAALTSSSVPFSSSGSVRQMVDILSSSSSTIPRYRSVLTSQTTEFEYWDANSMGVSSSNGYRVLNGNGPTSTFELFVEPSWELYKKKSYSNELPNAYSTEEYFYFHDLRNTVGNMKDTLTNFYALNLSGGYKIRNLPYEVRTTTKSQGYNPISKSNYYWYDNRFFTSSDFTVDETLAYNPGLVCLTPDPPPGGPTPPNPTCIAELPGHQIPVGYQLVIDSNTDRWWCPIDIYYGEERSYLPHNPYEQPGEERLQLPERNLKGKLFLRHTSVQVDINPNDSLVYTSVDPGAAHILRFAYNATDQVHFPVYPYAKLVTNYVEERNIYGQVKLEHDGKGLKTLYEYDQEKTVFFQDATNNCNSHYAQIFTNIGLPNTVTVGETLPDELITTYSYYKDHSVEKIIDPNLLEMKYSYDEYGRLEKTYRNNILLSKNAYSYWDNVLTDNFDQRATKNYVETYTLNEANQLQAERSRAYIDPQGRKYEVLTQISPDYTSPSTYDTKMIYSGLTKYDNWNRSIKQFKAFKVSSASPVSFSPYFDPNQINNSVVSNQTQYENNQRSRALRASKYGEDIATGHTVNSSYILLKGHILASELGLNTTEQSMIIPGTASQYVFLKTSAIDEDGKKVVTYSDALGRTVASKTYLTNNSTAITLFVYNSLGQQRIIINPLKQQSVYEYNLLGQIYKKTTVDAGVVKYIYNSDGQVVLEEDANTRAGIDNSDVPYMRRYTYDAFGRLVKQEKVKNGGEDFQHPFYELSYSDDGNFFNAPDPQNSQVPYADYQLNPGFGLSSDFCFNLQHYQVIWAGSAWVYSSPYAYLTTVGIEKEFVYHNALPHATIGFINTQLQGWLSSSNQANLKGKLSYSLAYNNSNTKIKVTAYSYTTDGNLAYEASQFDKTGLSSSGGITQGLTYKTYNLRGSVKEIVIDDGLNGSPEMTFQYDYDGWNRLTNVYSLSNKIASYEYIDELGLVDRLKYFANGTSCNLEVDDIDYVYDQRDRLTNINSHLFSQSLYYDNNLPSTGNSVYDVVAHQNYNGNINAIKINYHASSASNYSIMGSSMDGATYYGYSYDGMNRLTRADASVMNVLSNPVSTNPALKYGDEQLTYDKIGNITTLRRGLYYLPTNPTPANIIENWRYKYITGTNKLYQIVENVVPFTNQVANYTYDANGSLRTDDKKLLTSSTYGRANLPVSIVANGKNLSYLYNANDNRIYKENITDNTSEYYLQDFSGRTLGIYDFSSSQWTWYAFGKDRIAKIGTSSNEYYETDHLGNTRVTYTPTVNCTNSTITYSINNATDYFAYGKILRSFESTDEKYRFTGKERDNETELDYFEARFLDTDIARFLSLDPLQMEFMNYSPYNYVLGNPIGLIDLDGRKPKDPMAGYYAATMNSRTFGFSTRHPLIAINIGSVSSGSTNISTNVVRFATRIGLKENVQHEGSEVNAFRHTLWQSSITVNYGDKIAKEIGNAHEENPFVDLSKRTFVGKNALSQADQTADMLNNEIGRNIGKANPKANMKELALKTLEYQYKVGLYTAVAGDNGVINVKQTKISEEQYNAGVETINGLNNMGYNKSEQEKINSEALKDWQNRYVEP